MEFSLRPATHADCDWMWKLKSLTMRSHVEETWGTWDDATQEAHFRGTFLPANFSAIVSGGQAVGLLHVERTSSEIFLANLQLHPSAQNQGLGSAVVRELCAEAKARSVPLRLQVLKVNPARRFYDRLGFTVTGETASHVRLVWTPDRPSLSRDAAR